MIAFAMHANGTRPTPGEAGSGPTATIERVGFKLRATPVVSIDSVIARSGTEIVVEKTVHPDEPYLRGHYPGFPIYPGAFLVETACDAVTLLTRSVHDRDAELIGIRSIRFQRALRPNDTVKITCAVTDGDPFTVSAKCMAPEGLVARLHLTMRLTKPVHAP